MIDSDGYINYLPLPMHIYGYHGKTCPNIVKMMEKAMTSRELRHWKMASMLVDEGKLVRWVSADRVLGKDNIVTKAKINKVIHMQKSTIEKILLSNIEW